MWIDSCGYHSQHRYLEPVLSWGRYLLVQRRQGPAVAVLLGLALSGGGIHLGHLVVEACAREVGIANGVHSSTVPIASTHLGVSFASLSQGSALRGTLLEKILIRHRACGMLRWAMMCLIFCLLDFRGRPYSALLPTYPLNKKRCCRTGSDERDPHHAIDAYQITTMGNAITLIR